MSGIARSGKYPGVYWVHNDSGDKARIFAIKLDGTGVRVPGREPWRGITVTNAKNIDWEDVAIDGSTLYISDMGNNGNARKDLGVYVVPEPNPLAASEARATKFVPVRYPDQDAFPPSDWRFDCEAVFVYRKKLHFLTKHRANRTAFLPSDGTVLYRLDTTFTDRSNVLTRVDDKDGLGGWVTAADVSPSGRTLAVLTQAPKASVWFFDLTKVKGDQLLAAPARQLVFSGAKQCEAVCFESDEAVIVTNEQRELFRIAVP